MPVITKEILKSISPSAKLSITSNLEKYLDKWLKHYKIDNYLRIVHFCAQAAHESAHFTTLEEFASGAAYEGRKDLGNVQKGDGVRFKGRGIFQLTGRANYTAMSGKLGVDLVANPELAEDPEISVRTACEYWNSRGLSKYADADDILTITKKINGGTNGLTDRQNYLARAKKFIPKNISFDVDEEVAPDVDEEIVLKPAKKGDKGTNVEIIQKLLITKGAKIIADGDYGQKTFDAVKAFQTSVKIKATGIADQATIDALKA